MVDRSPHAFLADVVTLVAKTEQANTRRPFFVDDSEALE
jgi:hypothetical protein